MFVLSCRIRDEFSWMCCSCMTLWLVQVQKTLWFGSKYLFQSAQTELEVIRLPLKNKLLLLLQKHLETSAGLKKKHFDETETDGNVSRCPHTSGCPVGCNNTNIFLFFLHFCLFCVIIPQIFELFNGITNNDVLYEAEYQSAERCE